MKVRIFDVSNDDEIVLIDECDLREVYPEDHDAYQVALNNLTANGEHLEGGGAAPLVLIVADVN